MSCLTAQELVNQVKTIFSPTSHYLKFCQLGAFWGLEHLEVKTGENSTVHLNTEMLFPGTLPNVTGCVGCHPLPQLCFFCSSERGQVFVILWGLLKRRQSSQALSSQQWVRGRGFLGVRAEHCNALMSCGGNIITSVTSHLMLWF